jgi:hypothetical protein
VVVGEPLVRRVFWGPAGRGGHSGRTKRTSFIGVRLGQPRTKQNTRVCISKVGVDVACINRGERPPRVAILHRSGFRLP